MINFYAGLTGETETPVFAYNIPFFAKNSITGDVAIKLFEKGLIAGLKDSGDNWESLQKVLFYAQKNKEAKVYVGDERFFLAGGLIGTSGFISCGANIIPKTVIALERACRTGRKEEALKLYQFMLSVRDLYNAPPSIIAIIKAISEINGLCERWMFKPMDSLSSGQFQTLKKNYLKLTQAAGC